MTTTIVRAGRPLPGRRVAAALLAAALATAGPAACSDGGDDDDAPTSEATDAGAGAAEGACALLDTEAVSGMFGEEAAVVPAGEGASGERACLWEATGGNGDFPTRHQLQLQVYEDGTPLDPSTWGEGAEPVPDLGDEAYVVAAGPLGATAGYREGERSVVLRYAIVGGANAPTPGEQADELVDLLRTTASGG